MKRLLSSIFLISAFVVLTACGGGGGEDGDNMDDYWLSARRFANGTKQLKLINGPGYVVITPVESINIGPDADDPKAEEEDYPASVSINSVRMTTRTPTDGDFISSGCIYETNPETRTATLTINSVAQPMWTSIDMEATRRLVEIFGGIGRIVTPLGQKIYYKIEGRVVISIDFTTGTWTVLEGNTDYTPNPDLFVPNGNVSIIRSY